MASRKIEDVHKLILEKLLSDAGLECIRSIPESLESSSSSEEGEDLGPYEPEEEQIKEETKDEELPTFSTEESLEEVPEIFPTPSLRRVLPDRLRKFEDLDRIYVLPEEFKMDIDPELIPKIAFTAPQKYIDLLGELTGCVTYKKSLAEYWFLDTLANLLRRAQEDEMCRASQVVLIQWFCEWMKEIQHFDAADRQRMIKRFETNMLSAARYIDQEQRLPTPQEAGVFYQAEVAGGGSPTRAVPGPDSKHLVKFQGTAYECSLRDLTSIIHYIFDLFSTDYQYNLVRAIFTFSPGYTLIDAPYQMHHPKRLYTPLKLKPRKEHKKEKPAKGKKKAEVDTEEYLALLELRAREEKELNELEDKELEAWHRRNHILPLQFATDDEFFNKYWPSPPEPEPEAEHELKGKGKGKGKKKLTGR